MLIHPSERQNACQSCGFSFIEMIAVIAIISILCMIFIPVASRMKEKARQIDCKSHLRQIGVGITTYRNDHQGRNPGWLSNLYPGYLDDKSVYVCGSDINHGLGRTRPEGISDDSASSQKYPETIDNESNSARTTYGANNAIEACSYFYEFSAAPCPFGKIAHWPAGITAPFTWSEWKKAQLEYGDENSGVDNNGTPLPYSQSRMPIVRCYHHFDHTTIPGYPNATALKSGRIDMHLQMTINVAYAGNVFIAPLWWEGTPESGDVNLRD